MKVKPCQLNVKCPCADRGLACLKTKEERLKFNEQISKIQRELEKAKFKITDETD